MYDGDPTRCRLCGEPYGAHAADCEAKFRDRTNPDPDVQRWHERAAD